MRYLAFNPASMHAWFTGRYQTKPFTAAVVPGVPALHRLSAECRRRLTERCKPSIIKTTPAPVQIALMNTLTGLALKRSSFGKEVVAALAQAADYIGSIGATLSRLPGAVGCS